jgi:hypothetical protein
MPPDTAVAASLAALNGNGPPVQFAHYEVTWTDGKPPKLELPDAPAYDDPIGLCAWTTCVLRLDPAHPVTGAVHQGLRGAEGHVEIRRAGAPSIRFEPAGAINTTRRLLPILAWQLQPTDGEPYGFKDEHARRIAHVLRLLCGASAEITEAQETAGIIGTYLSGAVPIEDHTTHGSSAQRYEAALALQRDLDDLSGLPRGPVRYLRDTNTGEMVIRVGDLQAAARSHIGSSLPRGWLDARMRALGWDRCSLDGHAVDGRAGRHSAHARTLIYRGHLPQTGDTDDD